MLDFFVKFWQHRKINPGSTPAYCKIQIQFCEIQSFCIASFMESMQTFPYYILRCISHTTISLSFLSNLLSVTRKWTKNLCGLAIYFFQFWKAKKEVHLHPCFLIDHMEYLYFQWSKLKPL